MSERNLDFDTIIERRNTMSLKYDYAERLGFPADILPLWIADMDFKTSSYVQEALKEVVEHGIFGYSEALSDYYVAVREYFQKKYNYDFEERELIKTPGVVFAIAVAVRSLTNEGDAVMIQSPVYYPFSATIEHNGRKVVDSTLIYDEKENRYAIDFKDFEQKIVDNDVRLFLLCNPHNPVSRVWSKEELLKLGDICLKHNVLVVSDEIHADFTFVGKHHVFASLRPEFEDITVTCTSPSKTFNLTTLGSGHAGLDKIAICYVRLIRENFAPVSQDSQILFRKEQYRLAVVDGHLRASYDGVCPTDNHYDQALFNALKERIERMAAQVEYNALQQACQ